MTAEGTDVSALEEFERALGELDTARYHLTLFVTGASALSARAVGDVRALCEAYLQDRYELEVVDVRRNPELVRTSGVLASPTLIKDYPLPKRVLVGNLSDTARVLVALDIAPAADVDPAGPGLDPATPSRG